MQPVWDLPLDAAGMLFNLDSGAQVRVRPARPTDKEGMQLAFQRLSEQSRYFRFFSMRSTLSDDLATTLTEIDHVRHVAWGVFDPDQPSETGDPSGLAVGAARLIVDEDDDTTAEAALSVVDDYQRLGIGRFLIDLLVATGGHFGVSSLRFTVLAENRGMRALLPSLGATVSRALDDPTVLTFHLPVPSVDDVELPAGALYQLLRLVDRNV